MTEVRPLHSDLHKYIPSLQMAATSPALVHIRGTGLNVFKSTWSHCCSYPHSRKGIEAIQSCYIMVDVVCNILHKASRSTARYICSLKCCSVCFTSEYEEEYPCWYRESIRNLEATLWRPICNGAISTLGRVACMMTCPKEAIFSSASNKQLVQQLADVLFQEEKLNSCFQYT